MTIRKAKESDLIAIIKMLFDDKLGSQREDLKYPIDKSYYNAYNIINSDKNQMLMVIESEENEILGTLQLSFIQYLTYKGGMRAQIEAVRIKKENRGKRIGEKLIHWAINEARERGAHLIQLTTDKQRPEAINFYEKFYFLASHEGMKLKL